MATSITINPESLDFQLPDHCIAQEPLVQRDQAKLMVVRRSDQTIHHHYFSELERFFKAGDVLVLNKAKVDRVKLVGRKKTGGRVEIILVGPSAAPTIWKALVRPLCPIGTPIVLNEVTSELVLVGRLDSGENLLEFGALSPQDIISRAGHLPLPPYIKREENDSRHSLDEEYYQTVYADTPGSVAAPTAGLHFTPRLLQRIEQNGVHVVDIVLHVGWGTFKPVHSVHEHVMLPERYQISASSRTALQRAWGNQQRVVAVGTTVTRALESLPVDYNSGAVSDVSAETNLFIKPGYRFNKVSALVTNFHVPRSTPVSLVCAFAGLPLIEKAYASAIDHGYRFFSYGDAMLIL
jgi:S-adenosylmethionine:tRNA ribosyltransferase-isomerase